MLQRILPARLLARKYNVNFMAFAKTTFMISLLLSVFSTVWIGIYKFNFGIDFAGGISIEAQVDCIPDLAKMREVLTKLEVGEIMLQNFGSDYDLSIRVANKANTDAATNVELIKHTLQENFPYSFDYRKVDYVGPQVGAELIKSGVFALLFSFLGILVYIWLRFEWYFGLGIIIALLHDAILALGFMSVSRLDFNLSTIAAILTVIGYSVNDSVVIYDRLRENLRKYSKKPLKELINLSINETLSRTILTVFSTLLANLALIIWGGEAIYSFSMLVFVGIIFGTYSSIFISAPILQFFIERRVQN